MEHTGDLKGTVYVVDDDPSVLAMLEAIIATLGVEVQAFDSASNFLAQYYPQPYQCLVCDLRMPDIDGVELQRRLQQHQAPIPIIFLTGFAEVDVAVEAMRQGALDFLQKPFSAHLLLAKIRSGLELSQHRYHQWHEKRARDARLALLTPKELAIVHLVVEARSSREIAEQLAISVRTVENHRSHILEKLHVNSTVDLVKLLL